MRRGIAIGAVLTFVVPLASCSDDVAAEGLSVVATTTIIGDVVANVVGDDAAVVVLTPVGADPHDFQPSSAQVAAINEADLVVANGLFLEEGLKDVLDAAASDGVKVFELAPELDPIPFGGDGDPDSDDPHVWLDPVRMADAAGLIAAELTAIDDTVDWTTRAGTYAAELLALDDESEEMFAAIPDDARLLVTNHDALGYFAARYGFDVVGTVIPGGTTLADQSSEALAEAVAAELGDEVEVVSLYTGSLGEPGSGAGTLIDMLRTNAERVAAALTR
jgi:zinc/manganese transport system substrate-binding protein